MGTIENILSQEIVQRLGWTLVHFVWQGIAIGMILAIVLKLLHKSSANLRYIIACMALGLIVLMPAVTIKMVDVSVETIEPVKQAIVELPKAGAAAQVVIEMLPVESPVQVAAMPRVSLKDRFTEAVEPALPYVVVGWLVGVFGLSLWHLGGWGQLQRLRRQMVKQVEPTLKAKLQQLSNALGIRETIGLVESALVQVPTVVGHLKPVILLPASALTGLSPEQIEAILAHELAHIKRCDYLVNMLQTVVEILGFYHPAVWWVSHKIRVERENCCDDIAVSLCSDRVCYAKALTTMAEIRAGSPALAVAASGGSLFDRIRRLLGKDSANEGKLSWLPPVIAILLIIGLAILTSCALNNQRTRQVEGESDLEFLDIDTEMQNRFALMKNKAPEISITVFPIVMSEKPYKNVAEVVALMLEKADVNNIDVPDEVFSPATDSDIWQICNSFEAFVRERSIDTDYALFGEYVGTPQSGVKEVRCVVVDKAGNRVWVDRQTPEDDDFKRIKPNNPMLCSHLLVERLRMELGLPEQGERNSSNGKWAKHWQKDSDTPPASEHAEMAKRLAIMRGNFRDAKLVIFPTLVNGKPSKASADSIREMLSNRQLSLAGKASEEILLEITPTSNQQKRLWDLARKFKEYIQSHKLEADYALYTDYLISTTKGVGGVHFVICDGNGEWVIVDFQNEYQSDFKSISPKTAADCDSLVIKRIQNHLDSQTVLLLVTPEVLEAKSSKTGVVATHESKSKEQVSKKDEIEVSARFLLVAEDANEIAEFLADESLADARISMNGDPNLKGYLLDDEQAEQFLALVKADNGYKMLTAPTVILLDGESATMRVQKTIRYTAKGEGSDEPVEKEYPVGTEFYVMPTLQEDGKSIFLEYKFKHTNLLGFTKSGVPETEVANITSRSSFPEGRTFLLGGLKITDDQDGQKVRKVLLCLIKAAKVESDKSLLNN